MNELELTPPLPARSWLYSPEPVGVGTGMVESLASYLARTANAHWVSVSKLMASMTAGVADDASPKDHRVFNLMRMRSRELNGMQQVALRWSTRVANQTCRKEIDQLTLLPWRQILTPRALTYLSQCWCPHCLDDRLSTGQPIYWPLLWSLQAVAVCPVHRIPLEQQCHRCHAAVPPFASSGRIGFCPKCGVWLGFEGRPGSSGRPVKGAVCVTENALTIAQGALSMLAASSLIRESADVAKLVGLLEYCLQSADCRQAALAKQLGMHPVALSRLFRDRSLVNVPTLLNVLACCGLDVADFVQERLAALVSSGRLADLISRLPSKRGSAIQPRLKTGHRATTELLTEVQAALEIAVTEDDPPDLLTIARRVGLTTTRILWRRYPQLCRPIVEKRKSRFNRQEARQVLAEMASSVAPPPPLVTIAAQLKTSPVTLSRLFPDEVAAIKARRRAVKDVAALRRSVEALLAVDPPLSLSEISRRLGVKAHHIRQHLPDLRRTIVQRFAAYRHACSVERARKSIVAVRNAVVELKANGQLPTKSKVAAMLGRTRRLMLFKSESETFSAVMHELGLWQR